MQFSSHRTGAGRAPDGSRWGTCRPQARSETFGRNREVGGHAVSAGARWKWDWGISSNLHKTPCSLFKPRSQIQLSPAGSTGFTGVTASFQFSHRPFACRAVFAERAGIRTESARFRPGSVRKLAGPGAFPKKMVVSHRANSAPVSGRKQPGGCPDTARFSPGLIGCPRLPAGFRRVWREVYKEARHPPSGNRSHTTFSRRNCARAHHPRTRPF